MKTDPLRIVDSTVVGRWLLQSHLIVFAQRATQAEGVSWGGGRGRGRETHREKRGLRIRGAERGVSHPKSKRAPINHKGKKSTPRFVVPLSATKKRERAKA